MGVPSGNNSTDVALGGDAGGGVQKKPDSDGSNIGLIVGAIIGALACIAATAVTLVCFAKHKNKQGSSGDSQLDEFDSVNSERFDNSGLCENCVGASARFCLSPYYLHRWISSSTSAHSRVRWHSTDWPVWPVADRRRAASCVRQQCAAASAGNVYVGCRIGAVVIALELRSCLLTQSLQAVTYDAGF